MRALQLKYVNRNNDTWFKTLTRIISIRDLSNFHFEKAKYCYFYSYQI